MANLVERIIGIGITDANPKISGHQFMAALAELGYGYVTRSQVIAGFGITAEEESDLDWIINKLSPMNQLSRAMCLEELHNVILLAEAGLRYNTRASFVDRINLCVERYTTASDV